ncbi:MAG TPA: hypothetical protein VGC50_08025 [Gammaproteobacteria bacterium]
MAVVKRIVCLANSRKLNGRCVAGIELAAGKRAGWIRPVSDRENEEISEYERQYEDGSDPRVMDVIDLPLLQPRPRGYQLENWLLDPTQYWIKTGRLDWELLGRLAEPPGPLWIDGHHTYNGFNDKVPLELASGLTSSLRLVRVDRLMLSVFAPGEAFGNRKRRVQGRFRNGGIEYRLWVTDPTYERTYLARPDGNYEFDECFLTVSLGEPYNNACYKLIAAVMEGGKGSDT